MKRPLPIHLSFLLVILVGCELTPVVETSTSSMTTFTPDAKYQWVSVNDGGFLSQDPCGPPCFYGILPGITTDLDAGVIVSRNEVFDHCRIIDYTMYGGGRGLLCRNGIELGYEENIVSGVSFYPSENITIQQTIDLYGSPNQVLAMVVSLPDVPSRSQMSLYYDEFHMVIRPAEQDGFEIVLVPSTRLKFVAYYSEDDYHETRIFISKEGTPWEGYGTYDAFVP
jgi:hypothetical protein